MAAGVGAGLVTGGRRLVVRRLLDAVGDGGLGGGLLGRGGAETGVGLVGHRVLGGQLAGDGVLGRGLLGRHRLDVDDARPRLDHPGQQREVLAQRVALELRRQVHVAQVGVAGEGDAEHLVGLPLVPVGAGVDGEPRLDRHRVVGDVDLQRDADVALEVGDPGEDLEAGLATGHALADLGAALGRRLGRVVLAAAVRRRHPVDRRQVAEVLEAHRVERLAGLPSTSRWRRAPTGRRWAAGRSRPARRRCAGAARRRCPRAARRRAAPAAPSSRCHSTGPPPTTIGSRTGMTSCPSPRHLAAMSSLRIRCWSRTMPSSRASGRGGQPGT